MLGSEKSQVETNSNKIAHPCCGLGIDKSVRCCTYEPLFVEGFVEVARCHVLKARQCLMRAMGRSSKDENTLSGADSKPFGPCVELDLVSIFKSLSRV